MKISKLTTLTAAVAVALLTNVPRVNAQDAPATGTGAPTTNGGGGNGGGGGRRGGGGGGQPGGGFNFADIQKRINDNIKTTMKATDEEWSVIQPLLEKVEALQPRGGGMGGMGRRGGGQGGPGGGPAAGAPAAAPATAAAPAAPAAPTPPGSAESMALRAALDIETTTPEELKAKLAALRDARKKASVALEAAREDLKKVLTLRQEAVLVNMGILE